MIVSAMPHDLNGKRCAGMIKPHGNGDHRQAEQTAKPCKFRQSIKRARRKLFLPRRAHINHRRATRHGRQNHTMTNRHTREPLCVQYCRRITRLLQLRIRPTRAFAKPMGQPVRQSLSLQQRDKRLGRLSLKQREQRRIGCLDQIGKVNARIGHTAFCHV